jgi:thiamine-monophosphate kinase
VRESELLKHIYGRSADLRGEFPRVVVGPGDDCAVVDAAGPLLLKVDQLVEGRHFRADMPLDRIAHKAVARAVSDIAAMGGRPLAALAGATLPHDYPHADALFDAMAGAARRLHAPLVGGDITALGDGQPGPLALSISVIGTPHAARGPVLRSTAQIGDGVYVTGEVGGSFDAATGLGHHCTFEPRVEAAAALCDLLGPRLHAMIDVSDGVGIDAGRIAAASGRRLVLDASTFPLRVGVPGLDWRRACGDGEDYELLFTAAGEVPAMIAGVRVTRIGVVEAGAGCVARVEGREVDIGSRGWDH